VLYVRGDKPKKLYDLKQDSSYVVKFERRKEGKKITILSDSMFKAMFQNENRIKYPCKLISYYLDISYEELLKVLRLGKNELDKSVESKKGERCDYVAYINGSAINIEVNCNNSLITMERNLEYVHRLYSNKVNKGGYEDYTQVVQINLNNFAFEDEKTMDVFRIQNKEGIILSDKIIIVQIYVPNIRKKWYTSGIESLTEVEKYILTLVESDIDISYKLGKGDTIMEEYIEEAVEVSHEENLGEAYDKEWALKDQGLREGFEEGYEHGLECGFEQGIEQGKEFGIAENKKEMIKSMYQNGLELDLICKIANVSI